MHVFVGMRVHCGVTCWIVAPGSSFHKMRILSSTLYITLHRRESDGNRVELFIGAPRVPDRGRVTAA